MRNLLIQEGPLDPTVADQLQQEMFKQIHNDPMGTPDQFFVGIPTNEHFYTYGSQSYGATDAPLPPVNGRGILMLQNRVGELTYLGPGQIGLLMFINFKRLGRKAGGLRFAIELTHALKASVNKKFNTNLDHRGYNLGLYKENEEKVVSLGWNQLYRGWMAYMCSINLNVDLTKYRHLAICGQLHRPMGNLLSNEDAFHLNLFQTGSDIITVCMEQLYTRQNNQSEP